MKTAIIHYWLVGMRGGEKVLESLCELYPDADIYTHVHDPEKISDKINSHNIHTTFINQLPMARSHYQTYLPLMPLALEQLDLRGYDLIISCESGPCKGIIPPPDALHVSYVHTTMRYVWDMYPDYRNSAGFLKKLLMPPIMHYLRLWDVSTASRVDAFAANSNFVKKRLARFYHRDATVIHPPVDTDEFRPAEKVDDYYLMVGELVHYKKADLAVKAFNEMGKKLVIIGGGEQLPELRSLAESNISFLGRQPFEAIKTHFATCRALIFPGIEDFGIVPVEAMASGRPVIAFAKGGAMDTVEEGVTGVFFHEQTPESLMQAVGRFEREIDNFDAKQIRSHAEQFSKEIFKQKIQEFIDSLL